MTEAQIAQVLGRLDDIYRSIVVIQIAVVFLAVLYALRGLQRHSR